MKRSARYRGQAQWGASPPSMACPQLTDAAINALRAQRLALRVSH